ncbi:MAG: zinc-ribbon domain-containing protein [Christensenellaceae bacterium]|jgi:hypothetical protein|nr:zinc-ribbon domain-containing protein [Christensenellaceae bacterium]
MFCPHCGAQISENAIFCPVCGKRIESAPPEQPAAAPGPEEPAFQQPQPYENPYAQPQAPAYARPVISDFLAGNIVLTVLSFLCCNILALIPGIIGIVFSSGVKASLREGGQAEAEGKAKTAKILFFVTLGLLVLGLIANIVVFGWSLSGAGGFQEIIREMEHSFY